MATFKINDDFDVNISVISPIPGRAEVQGAIWNRKTSKPTGIRVKGEGRTISAAQDRARAKARQLCPDSPDDEDGPPPLRQVKPKPSAKKKKVKN